MTVALIQNGGGPTQTHCAETGEFIPDRSLTPLVITPVVRVQDPDGVIADGVASLTGVSWYVLPEDIAQAVPAGTYIGNELSQYLVTEATEGYSVDRDGSLRVEANIPYLQPVVLVFTGNVPDIRSGKLVKVQDSLLLSTSSVAVPATLTLDKPASWLFNPIADTGLRTIKASLKLGGLAPDPTKVRTKFWWYRASGNNETLIDEDEDFFYESGQNTDTLVIDPEYLDSERIICKAVYALGSGSLPATPGQDCLSAETVVSRRYPAYDFENYVHGGVEVSPTASHVKSECVVTIGQQVLSNPSRYFTVIWSVKEPVHGSEWRVLGYGDTIMIPASEIEGGADIGLELEEFEPLGALADDDGSVLMDDDGSILTL